jgi:aspartyl-tRNA(Asn)/glutamyl-tRNA(Gln) amidotransferase subunit A
MKKNDQSIYALHHELKNQRVTSVELTQRSLNTIESINPKINAFLSQCKDQALQKAEQADAAFKRGDDCSLLAGIPIAIKDNIHIKGIKTTCASLFLKEFVAPFNATVSTRLDHAGAVIVGKVNLDEFAMGSSTENSAFGPTKNPWDITKVPGGSSGGSAASVASGQVIASIGSDTGGSIRQPASFCGVVGVKPTYGRVSRYGLVAFASSLDQIGPLTQTVADSAALLNVICGHDPHDATSSQQQVPDFTKALTKDIKGLKIAVPSELLGDTIDDGVKEKVIAALDLFKSHGATWNRVSMPSFQAAIPTYYVIAPAEASANLARFDGVRYTTRAESENIRDMYIRSRSEGFGEEVKRRIILGTFVLSSGYYDAYYLKAQKARTLVQNDFNRIYSDHDVIMSPTSPTTAFSLGQHCDDPLAMYMADLATIPANMAGVPAMSIPCGFHEKLPVGLQIFAKAFDEETMLRVGDFYQSVTDFHNHRPEITQ